MLGPLVAGIEGASSSEFDPETPDPVIATMAEQTDVIAGEHVTEATAIVTCNRLEVYTEVSAFHSAVAAVGEAIAAATRPPRIWLQMSIATIYADRRDRPNDEATGIIGGDEPHVPLSHELAITHPAARSVSPSANFSRTSPIDPVVSKLRPNGFTPRARSASIFWRRSAISSFSSSML